MRLHVLVLRPAVIDDAPLLYAWRRDPVTVAMSAGPPPVSLETHTAWVAAHLAELSIALSVGTTPCGTLRLAPDQFVSVTVAPTYRRQGVATAMLLEALASYPGPWPLRAVIKPENTASLHAFTQAGFVGVGTTPEGLWLLTCHARPPGTRWPLPPPP